MRPVISGGRTLESSRWFGLFLIMRAAGAAIVPLLLVLQDLTSKEYRLGALGIAYAAVSAAALMRLRSLQTSLAVWVFDCAAVLGLVLAYGEWRSPFYLLALSTLILPVTSLPLRRALAFGLGFVLAYLAVAVMVGVDWNAVSTSARMESFGVFLLVPLIVTIALAFASDLLRRLERERQRSERLALEAERQRIAWELHDSAKQRIHAAHLLLTSVTVPTEASRLVDLALEELRAATADMDTSLRDLREPMIDGDSLGEALQQWADRLQAGSGMRLEVIDDAPILPPFMVAHVYRIGREALTNAVRHAGATTAQVVLRTEGGRLRLLVTDDGAGMPESVRADGTGLISMRHRAEALGAELDIAPRPDGCGTVVSLDAPLAEVPQT